MACHFSPDVVRTWARGTLGNIIEGIGMKNELRDVVYAAVGCGDDTDPRDFASIEEGDFGRMVEALLIGDAPLNLIQKGSLNRLRAATAAVARNPQVDPADSRVASELVLFSPGPSSAASTGTANGNEAVAPLRRSGSPAAGQTPPRCWAPLPRPVRHRTRPSSPRPHRRRCQGAARRCRRAGGPQCRRRRRRW